MNTYRVTNDRRTLWRYVAASLSVRGGLPPYPRQHIHVSRTPGFRHRFWRWVLGS